MNGSTGTLRGGNNAQFVMQSLQELDAELTRDGISLAFCKTVSNALIEGIQCKNHHYVAAILKILLRGDYTGKLANVSKVRLGAFVHKLSGRCGVSLPAGLSNAPLPRSPVILSLAGELVSQWLDGAYASDKNATQSEKEKRAKIWAEKKAKREQLEAKVQRHLALFRTAARQLGIALYWQKEARFGRPARVHGPVQPPPMRYSLQQLAECWEFTPAHCAMFAIALREGIVADNDYYVEEILKILLRNDARKKLTNLSAAGLGKLVSGMATNQVPHRLGGQIGRAKRTTPFPDRVASVAVAVREQWKDLATKRKWDKKAPLRRRLALFRVAARQLDIVLYWQKMVKLSSARKRAADKRKRDADELLFGMMRKSARIARERVANEFGFS